MILNFFRFLVSSFRQFLVLVARLVLTVVSEERMRIFLRIEFSKRLRCLTRSRLAPRRHQTPQLGWGRKLFPCPAFLSHWFCQGESFSSNKVSNGAAVECRIGASCLETPRIHQELHGMDRPDAIYRKAIGREYLIMWWIRSVSVVSDCRADSSLSESAISCIASIPLFHLSKPFLFLCLTCAWKSYDDVYVLSSSKSWKARQALPLPK